MAFKILIICGHGAGDCGAVGNGYEEADLTREFGKLVKSKLEAYECIVDIYDIKRNAFNDVTDGVFKIGWYDYVLEVHFNSSSNQNAKGTEIFVTTHETGISVEQGIMRELGKHFVLRDNDPVFDGVKKTNFLVIDYLKRHYGISGALLEVCFISSASDMKVYSEQKQNIAQGVASAITSEFGIEEKPKPKNIAVVKYMADDRKEYYMNVYKADKLEKTGATGYYNSLLTIGTDGDRNCFPNWDSKSKVACGTSKGTKPKGTKILCRIVATVKKQS